MEASMQGENVAERIAEVRRANEELRRTRAELLVDHGYPADYTEVRYECPLCGDSGFVDARMCVCMKKKLVEAGFEASGMGNLLREQSFESFDLSYYRNDPAAAE
jgi:DNA replication protein DnaC